MQMNLSIFVMSFVNVVKILETSYVTITLLKNKAKSHNGKGYSIW